MDVPANSSPWIPAVTLILWILPPILVNRGRIAFRSCSPIVFLRLPPEQLLGRYLEMGGLVHAASGGLGGYLLLNSRRLFKRTPNRPKPEALAG
jgi:hypothetical protein